MKLNIHILYDELHEFASRILADEDISLDLSGIRFLPGDVKLPCTDYIYLTKAADLYHYTGVNLPLSLICIGEIDEAFLKKKRWEAIVLNNNADERTVFEMVQQIFETYSNWNDEISEAMLRKESIQKVMDIGTRYLWNPIALFDMSYCLITYAGPDLPDDITGTIWEIVLSKGYSPIEVLPYQERIEAYQRIVKNRTPFFSHPPKTLIDNLHIIAAVYHDNRLFGVLAGTDINRPFSLGQVSLINHLKNILECFINNNNEFVNINENTAYFIDRILQGFSIEPGVVSYHLQKRGWSLRGNYRIYFFSAGLNVEQTGASQHLIFRIEKILRKAMVFPYENGVVAIHNNRVAEHENHFELEGFLKEMNLRAGVSMIFPNFMDLKHAYIQSKIALREGMKLTPDRYLIDFRIIYTGHVINSLAEVTSLKSLCEPRLLQLAMCGSEKDRELIRSLRLYLFNERNIYTTAALLKIHRNTLMYRLQKIEKLLDLSLKDLDEQVYFNLYLTCLITEYL